MSRIHDALKRAEEQRLALGGTPEQSSGEAPLDKLSVGLQEIVSTAEVNSATIAPEDPDLVPAADRLENCTRTEWSPTKDAIFLTTQDNHAPGIEEFRTLRAKLFQIRATKPLKKILVSSALPGEGKSFVSANLAQAFARQRGSRTLLIDADLRKPHSHELLGAPSSPGLCDYLSGNISALDAIQRSSRNEDLFFIPGGKVSSSAAELIGNGRMQVLLESLAPLFNWIIIDSSPVVVVSDPTRFAESCDGVLLVVKAGSTPHEFAERAKRNFQGTPLLGVVFNQASFKEKYSYAGYNYGR